MEAASASATSDVLNQKDEVRKTLGYLPQEFGVYPKVSAEKLLDHFAVLKGIAGRRARKEVVEALLRQTNLWEVRKQKLGGYSGGMRQRFGVAVALLGNPKLMIVDEPTAGLDPAERVRFLNLLSELGENSVVLLSTHIVEDVSELCTRMAIIDQGEILLEAEPLRRGRRASRPDLAPRDFEGSSPRAGTGARGDLDEAPRGTHRRARLQRHGARSRLRARRAGPRRCLLQRDGGSHRPATRAAGAGGEAMKLREIFRFEFVYQARRVATWLYFAVLGFFAFVQSTDSFLADARNGDHFLGAPFVVAARMVVGCLFWVLLAAHVAGDAAARDAQTGMHPLTYTAPVSKADYLGGRFLAAFVLNALILLAVPAGILFAVYSPEVEAEIRGPFWPAAFLTAYVFIALPNAFVIMAIQFSFAALSRRAIASYLGGLLFLITAFVVAEGVALLPEREVGQLLDPTGIIAIEDLTNGWTPIEKNTRLIGLDGTLLWNRLLWIGIALATLAFTYIRFRLSPHTATTRWSRITRRRDAHAPTPTGWIERSTPISVPQVRRTFGFATHARQTLAIAWTSFRKILTSWSGLVLLTVVAILAVLSVLEGMHFMGVPLLPRADYVLHNLIFPEVPPAYFIIPLLIVFWSGQLVSARTRSGRERDR